MIDWAQSFVLFPSIFLRHKISYVLYMMIFWELLVGLIVVMAQTTMSYQKFEIILDVLIIGNFNQFILGNKEAGNNKKLNKSLINFLSIIALTHHSLVVKR